MVPPYHPEAHLIEDHRAGDMICPTCGLVVGDRIVDVGTEWRSFNNEKSCKDPSRVGAPENPLLSGGDLSTSIAAGRDGDNEMSNLQRKNNSSNDRALLAAFGSIREMAARIHLPNSIQVPTTPPVHQRKNNSSNDRALLAAFGSIREMAARIHLPNSIQVPTTPPVHQRKNNSSNDRALLAAFGSIREMAARIHLPNSIQVPTTPPVHQRKNNSSNDRALLAAFGSIREMAARIHLPNSIQVPTTPPVHQRKNNSSNDRALLAAFGSIREMAARIHLPNSIQDQANKLFKEVLDSRALRGKNSEAQAAACLYIACRKEGVPRTFKEICAVSRTSKKEIGKCFKLIVRALETNLDHITSDQFMSRFCGNLGVSQRVQSAATAIAKEAVKLDLVAGRSPISIAAAAIFMATQASNDKKSAKDIGEIAGVAEVTIKQSYKLLYPRADALFPESYPYRHLIYQLPLP